MVTLCLPLWLRYGYFFPYGYAYGYAYGKQWRRHNEKPLIVIIYIFFHSSYFYLNLKMENKV